jgi:hypothetical protein
MRANRGIAVSTPSCVNVNPRDARITGKRLFINPDSVSSIVRDTATVTTERQRCLAEAGGGVMSAAGVEAGIHAIQ